MISPDEARLLAVDYFPQGPEKIALDLGICDSRLQSRGRNRAIECLRCFV